MPTKPFQHNPYQYSNYKMDIPGLSLTERQGSYVGGASTDQFGFNPYQYSNYGVQTPDLSLTARNDDPWNMAPQGSALTNYEAPEKTGTIDTQQMYLDSQTEGGAGEIYRDQNGNYVYRGKKPTVFEGDEQPSFGEWASGIAGNVAPLAVGAANVGLQARGFKNMLNTKLGLQPRLLAPSYSRIAPVRSLPTELESNALNQIYSNVAQSRTSDPTIALVEKAMVGSQRQKALDNLTSMKAQVELGERGRYDQALTAQQAENVKRRDINTMKLEAKDKADTRANVAYQDQMRQLWGTTLGDMTKAMHAENAANFTAGQTERQNKMTNYNTQLSRYQSALNNLDPTAPDYLAKSKVYTTAMGKLQTELDTLMKEPVARASDVRGGFFKNYIPSSDSLVDRDY